MSNEKLSESYDFSNYEDNLKNAMIVFKHIIACDYILMNEYKFLMSEIKPIYSNDEIKLYCSVQSTRTYDYSAVTSISAFLKCIVYYLGNNCEIKCYYVKNGYVNCKKQLENQDVVFKIACIPYGTQKCEEENTQEIDGIWKTTCKRVDDRNKLMDKRLIRSYRDAIENEAMIVFSAEMVGSPKIDDELFKVFIEKPNAIIWTPTYHDNNFSMSSIYDPHERRKRTIYKALAYNGLSYKEDVPFEEQYYPIECIDSNNVFNVFHIDGFGRVLFLICSDFFHSEMEKIISQMRIDVVLISSDTGSYGKFNDDGAAYIKSDRKLLLQCNNCHYVLEKYNDLDKRIRPINIISKEKTKLVEEKFNDDECWCNPIKCGELQLCYYMVEFKFDGDRIIVSNVEWRCSHE